MLSNLLSSKSFPLTFSVLSGKFTEALRAQIMDIIQDQVHSCNKALELCFFEWNPWSCVDPAADCPTGARLRVNQGAFNQAEAFEKLPPFPCLILQKKHCPPGPELETFIRKMWQGQWNTCLISKINFCVRVFLVCLKTWKISRFKLNVPCQGIGAILVLGNFIVLSQISSLFSLTVFRCVQHILNSSTDCEVSQWHTGQLCFIKEHPN